MNRRHLRALAISALLSFAVLSFSLRTADAGCHGCRYPAPYYGVYCGGYYSALPVYSYSSYLWTPAISRACCYPSICSVPTCSICTPCYRSCCTPCYSSCYRPCFRRSLWCDPCVTLVDPCCDGTIIEETVVQEGVSEEPTEAEGAQESPDATTPDTTESVLEAPPADDAGSPELNPLDIPAAETPADTSTESGDSSILRGVDLDDIDLAPDIAPAIPPSDADIMPALPTLPFDDGASNYRPNTTEAVLAVSVPASAHVFINDHATVTPGAYRQYVSRGLNPAASYSYQVRAEIERDGRPVSQTKHVQVTAGRVSHVAFDFNRLQPEAQPTTLTLHVPEDAKVTLAGAATISTGEVREFSTTRLLPGQTWDDYRVDVRLERDGEVQTRSEVISLQAGKAHSLWFDFENHLAQAE